ncbi:MAG: hypothetical protein WAL59_00295, partial [Roseiarcus sp.]
WGEGEAAIPRQREPSSGASRHLLPQAGEGPHAPRSDYRQAMIGKVNSSVNVSGVDIVVGIPNIDSAVKSQANYRSAKRLTEEQR